MSSRDQQQYTCGDLLGQVAGTIWSIDITYEAYSSTCVSEVDVLVIGCLRADFFLWGVNKEYPRLNVGFGFAAVGPPSGKWTEHTLEYGFGSQFFPVSFSCLFRRFTHVRRPSGYFLFCGKWAQNKRGRTNALPYTFLKSWVDFTILRLPPVQLVVSIPTIQHSTNCNVRLKQHKLNKKKKYSYVNVRLLVVLTLIKY